MLMTVGTHSDLLPKDLVDDLEREEALIRGGGRYIKAYRTDRNGNIVSSIKNRALHDGAKNLDTVISDTVSKAADVGIFAALTPEQKIVLNYHFIKGLAFDDIGRIMKVHPNDVALALAVTCAVKCLKEVMENLKIN